MEELLIQCLDELKQQLKHTLDYYTTGELAEQLAAKLQEKGVLLPTSMTAQEAASLYGNTVNGYSSEITLAEEAFEAGWQAREQAQ